MNKQFQTHSVETMKQVTATGQEVLAGLMIQVKKHDALKEVVGCFEAAEAEGLAQALAETTDERLKDLIERRVMHALYAAQKALE